MSSLKTQTVGPYLRKKLKSLLDPFFPDVQPVCICVIRTHFNPISSSLHLDENGMEPVCPIYHKVLGRIDAHKLKMLECFFPKIIGRGVYP